MGPVSKSTVDSVLCAVSLGVCLMDADSSFVVAQVIPPLCVSSSSVQEGASGVQKKGKNRHSLVTQTQHYQKTCCQYKTLLTTLLLTLLLLLCLPTLRRTLKPVTAQYLVVSLQNRQLNY